MQKLGEGELGLYRRQRHAGSCLEVVRLISEPQTPGKAMWIPPDGAKFASLPSAKRHEPKLSTTAAIPPRDPDTT